LVHGDCFVSLLFYDPSWLLLFCSAINKKIEE
jgi:hypothetical protein